MNLARALCFVGIVFAASCGGSKIGSSSTTTGPPQSSSSPKIFMVIEENHSYEQLVGSPRMPFLNSLIASDAVADNYFANSHPSLPNYFMLTTGQLITDSDLF